MGRKNIVHLNRPVVGGLDFYGLLSYFRQFLASVSLWHPISTHSRIRDQTFQRNIQFWNQILETYEINYNVVRLEKFYVTDWYPRTPGLYHTQQARQLRRSADEFWIGSRNNYDVYSPNGKIRLIDGGYGSYRFDSIRLFDRTLWLHTATSDGYCHTGIPLAIPEHFKISDNVKLNYPHNIIGRIVSLDSVLRESFSHMERLPQFYLEVDSIEVVSGPQRPIKITPTAFFTRERDTKEQYSHQDLDGFVTFVTCITGSNKFLDKATDWIKRYVGKYKGKIQTDYDELRPAFAHVPFSLSWLREIKNSTSIHVTDNDGTINIAVGNDNYQVIS